jgi:hypothetical protein
MITRSTISSTFAPRLKSFTGFLIFCSNGPIALKSPKVAAILYPILPLFKSGKINILGNVSKSGSFTFILKILGS